MNEKILTINDGSMSVSKGLGLTSLLVAAAKRSVADAAVLDFSKIAGDDLALIPREFHVTTEGSVPQPCLTILRTFIFVCMHILGLCTFDSLSMYLYTYVDFLAWACVCMYVY
jgi:hypothetical protein